MTALDAPAITAARRVPEWLILTFDYVTDFGKSFWFLVPIALALAALALIGFADASAHVSAPACGHRGTAWLSVACDRSAGTVLQYRQAPGWTRPPIGGGKHRSIQLPAAGLERRICKPAVGSFDRRVCSRHGDRRVVALDQAFHVDLCRCHCRKPGRAHGASFRATSWPAPSPVVVGVLLVRDWFASRGLAFVLGPTGWFALARAFARPDQKGCPSAYRPIRSSRHPRRGVRLRRSHIGHTMNETFASADLPAVSVVVPVRNEAGNLAPLIDEIAAALGKGLRLRGDLRQRWFERPHRG